jgi:hypothetical protein
VIPELCCIVSYCFVRSVVVRRNTIRSSVRSGLQKGHNSWKGYIIWEDNQIDRFGNRIEPSARPKSSSGDRSPWLAVALRGGGKLPQARSLRRNTSAWIVGKEFCLPIPRAQPIYLDCQMLGLNDPCWTVARGVHRLIWDACGVVWELARWSDWIDGFVLDNSCWMCAEQRKRSGSLPPRDGRRRRCTYCFQELFGCESADCSFCSQTAADKFFSAGPVTSVPYFCKIPMTQWCCES